MYSKGICSQCFAIENSRAMCETTLLDDMFEWDVLTKSNNK